MLSEKSVELNLTAELLTWLRYVTGVTHTAIGPSQAEEGVWGYDVSFHGGGSAAALIQYKRAYVNGSIWTWRLNRTKRQDQHARLQFLESVGYPVFYAFPQFATPSQLAAWRRRLLTATWWYPPSYINPPGGPTGHHEVTLDTSSGVWTVHSPEPVQIRPPLTIAALAHELEEHAERDMSIEEFVSTINRVMLAADHTFESVGNELEAESDFAGQSLVIRYR